MPHHKPNQSGLFSLCTLKWQRTLYIVVVCITFALERCSVRLYRHLFVGGLMSCLRYLCLFVYNGVQHILCCFFPLVYPMVPVSLDCQFFIADSGFSNIYFDHHCFQLAMH